MIIREGFLLTRWILVRFDWLSILPPEIILNIFSHVTLKKAPSWGHEPLYISKALLSFTRPLVFGYVQIQTWRRLDLFVQAILAKPFFGGSVRKLNLFFDLADANVHLPHQLRIFTQSVKFWMSFAQIEDIRIGICLPIFESFKRLINCDDEFTFDSLEHFQLRNSFKDWASPYSFALYEPLFLLAPILLAFDLGAFGDEAWTRSKADLDDKDCPVEDGFLPAVQVVSVESGEECCCARVFLVHASQERSEKNCSK